MCRLVISHVFHGAVSLGRLQLPDLKCSCLVRTRNVDIYSAFSHNNPNERVLHIETLPPRFYHGYAQQCQGLAIDSLIEESVIDRSHPSRVASKQRLAPRGDRARRCNSLMTTLLNAREQQTTESSPLTISNHIQHSTWTAVEVVNAFCHRAALAYQLVPAALQETAAGPLTRNR